MKTISNIISSIIEAREMRIRKKVQQIIKEREKYVQSTNIDRSTKEVS